MPGLNGVRLCKHLRVTDPAAARRVRFMPGDVVNASVRPFLAEPDPACRSKPFLIGEFRAAGTRLLRDSPRK
jgi:hypothetical protein